MPICIDITACILGLGLSTLFPETLNLKLPDTFGDTKAILRRGKKLNTSEASPDEEEALAKPRRQGEPRETELDFTRNKREAP